MSRTIDQRARLIDRFCESMATQKIVKALEQQLPVMTLEEMQGLAEHVRVECWKVERLRAINRRESFPELKDFSL